MRDRLRRLRAWLQQIVWSAVASFAMSALGIVLAIVGADFELVFATSFAGAVIAVLSTGSR